jgi:AcrR family transcriptional regulator
MRAPRQPPRTPSRSQPRTLTGRQTELLDRLEELFLNQGFAHLTLDDIVSELRCSKMTLYMLAPSRELLTLTVLRRFFDQADKNIQAQLDTSATPTAQIATCIFGTAAEMEPMTPACFNDVLQFETTRELYDAFARSWQSRFTRCLVALFRPDGAESPRMSLAVEVARLVLHELYSGELAIRTGLDRQQALEQLTGLIHATQSDGRSPARVKRLK